MKNPGKSNSKRKGVKDMAYLFIAIFIIAGLIMYWSIVKYIILLAVVGFGLFYLCLMLRKTKWKEEVSIDDLYDFYFSSDLTELQKDELWKRKYESVRIVGEGIVKSVQYHAESSLKDENPLIRDEDDHHFPDFVSMDVEPISSKFTSYTLFFPGYKRKELISIKKGQRIKFSSNLSSGYEHTSSKISFHSCSLIGNKI